MQGIVAGSIHKEVELRTSKNGNPFATFTIRENLNGSTRWWQAIAFNESVIEAVKELSVGEGLAIAGEISAEIYAPAGSESRINWRISVDAVLTAKAKRKPRAEKERDASSPERRTGREIASKSWAAPATGSADASDIPF